MPSFDSGSRQTTKRRREDEGTSDKIGTYNKPVDGVLKFFGYAKKEVSEYLSKAGKKVKVHAWDDRCATVPRIFICNYGRPSGRPIINDICVNEPDCHLLYPFFASKHYVCAEVQQVISLCHWEAITTSAVSDLA